MAIRVVYNPDLAVASQVTLDSGEGQLRMQAQQIARQDAMRQAELDERAREFDFSQAMRARSEYLQGQQYQRQLAARQAAGQQQLYAQQAAQEHDLQKMYLAQQFGQDDIALQDQLLYQRQNALGLDEQAAAMFKEMRKTKFDATGQRLFSEFESQFRDIQGAPLRAEQKNEVLSELMRDVQLADLAQYEAKEPTAWDDAVKWTPLSGQPQPDGKSPPAPGYYWGQIGMRNDVPEYGMRYIPDPGDPTRYQQLPDGSGIIIDPTSGQPTHIPAPKPAAAPEVVNEQEQFNDYLKGLGQIAGVAAKTVPQLPGGGPSRALTMKEIRDAYNEARTHWKTPGGADATTPQEEGGPRTDIPQEMGGVTDDAESPGGMVNQDGLAEGEYIIEAADGARAVIGADGQVKRVLQ